MLGLKRDLRVVNENIIYPQEVRIALVPKTSSPRIKKKKKKKPEMRLSHINLFRHTALPKNYSVIDMRNARLSLENYSLKPLKTFPEWRL